MDKKLIESILKLDLFKELGREDVEPEVKESVLDDAAYIVTRGLWIRIMESLSEEKQTELSEMLEKNPDDADPIIQFLKREVPNYEDLAKEEVANYKSLLLARVK